MAKKKTPRKATRPKATRPKATRPKAGTSSATPRWLSPTAYAQHRGVSRTAVRKALEQGRLAGAVREKAGRAGWVEIDAAAADRLWDANSDRAKRRGPSVDRPDEAAADRGVVAHGASDESIPSYAESQARTAHYRAEAEELRLAELRGELVRRVDVERATTELFAALRTRLVVALRRAARKVATISNPDDAQVVLEDAADEAMTRPE